MVTIDHWSCFSSIISSDETRVFSKREKQHAVWDEQAYQNTIYIIHRVPGMIIRSLWLLVSTNSGNDDFDIDIDNGRG